MELWPEALTAALAPIVALITYGIRQTATERVFGRIAILATLAVSIAFSWLAYMAGLVEIGNLTGEQVLARSILGGGVLALAASGVAGWVQTGVHAARPTNPSDPPYREP